MRIESDIAEPDLRALVQLMSRTICLPGTLQEKRCALLDGLLLLTGSHNWIWQLRQENNTEAITLSYLAGSCSLPHEIPMAEENPSAQQILPNCIIGRRHFSTGETGVIIFLRENSASGYGQRETLIIRMVLEEVPWLYRAVWIREQSQQDGLPQRQKDVLVHMSKGRTRKEIASLMGISVHTVSGYTKVLFTTYGVHSQAELMNLFYKGTITIKQ